MFEYKKKNKKTAHTKRIWIYKIYVYVICTEREKNRPDTYVLPINKRPQHKINWTDWRRSISETDYFHNGTNRTPMGEREREQRAESEHETLVILSEFDLHFLGIVCTHTRACIGLTHTHTIHVHTTQTHVLHACTEDDKEVWKRIRMV